MNANVLHEIRTEAPVDKMGVNLQPAGKLVSRPQVSPVRQDREETCECGHLKDRHDYEGCLETMPSGFRCPCPKFQR